MSKTNGISSQEYTQVEMAELGIPQYVNRKDVEALSGLAEIASYLGRSISFTRQLIKHRGLPAVSIGRGSPHITTKTLIDKWIVDNHFKRCLTAGWIVAGHRSEIRDLVREAIQTRSYKD